VIDLLQAASGAVREDVDDLAASVQGLHPGPEFGRQDPSAM